MILSMPLIKQSADRSCAGACVDEFDDLGDAGLLQKGWPWCAGNRKLDVSNRAEATLEALRLGLLT
jgi:hypothetical protein